jgi:hypothetical protein
MSETSELQNGVLLQGEDGAVYFVPDDRLDEFRVSEANSAKVRKLLESDEVSGFDFGRLAPSSTFELAPNVRPLPAFQGPLRRLPGRGPNIGEVNDDSPTEIL